MIEKEVGEDVYSAGVATCKLALFERWLYGTSTVASPRLAPSIIARSEAELLGISSPRFAIRVYLGTASFANIRRRKTTARQIRKTYAENIADHFLEITSDKKAIINSRADQTEKDRQLRELETSAIRSVNWIADCLLEPPRRLIDEGFRMLTCTLGDDYGEDEIRAATPFVTHISIGGGLCGQAACFMALCLLENSEIFGISEITCLAAEEEKEFEIHGLTPSTIERFLNESASLGAQLQCVHNPLSDGELKTALEQIRCALRTYVENRIPVLLMLSASRMQGLRPGEYAPSIDNPIIASSGDSVDTDSRRLPLGSELDYLNSAVSEYNDTKHDYHCVVVVGCNREASCFLINDPATMPFVKATVEQLFESRNYKRFDESTASESDLSIGLQVQDSDLGEFQFLSVAPQNVNLGLLHDVSIAPQVGGLLHSIQPAAMTGLYGIAYPLKAAQLKNIQLHLGQWNGSEMQFRSGLELVGTANHVLATTSLVTNRWYWVSAIDTPDKSNQFSRSLAFWEACYSVRELKTRKQTITHTLYCVIAQRLDGEWTITFNRQDKPCET